MILYTKAKVRLCIHVCIKFVSFYKCLLAFIAFKWCFFYSYGSKSGDTVESGDSGDSGESGDPVESIDSGKSDQSSDFGESDNSGDYS